MSLIIGSREVHYSQILKKGFSILNFRVCLFVGHRSQCLTWEAIFFRCRGPLDNIFKSVFFLFWKCFLKTNFRTIFPLNNVLLSCYKTHFFPGKWWKSIYSMLKEACGFLIITINNFFDITQHLGCFFPKLLWKLVVFLNRVLKYGTS